MRVGESLRHNPLQLQFIAAAVLFVLLFAAYSWQSVAAYRARIEGELVYVNRVFVEGTRSAFITQRSRLLLIGEQLRRVGATVEPESGRAFIEQMAGADSGIVGFGLASADGQLKLVSGVPPGAPLPNLLQGEETRESFRTVLDSREFALGRPYEMDALGSWVIPMRVPLIETDGGVAWVITAGLNLEGGNTLWARTQLPEGMGLVLVRNDGYLQYGSRLDSRRLSPDAVRALYGKRQPEQDMAMIRRAAAVPEGGFLVIDRPDFGGEILSAAIALPEYGLVAVTGMSLRLVYERALRGLLLPFGLVVLYLAASWGAYAFARRQQARHDERLMHLAHHDPLTNLPNRAVVMDRLRQAIAMSVRQQRSAALLFVDLDNFKVINDTYGHRFGDELLCRMSSIFAEAVRPGDTVARLGGDEFLIVLPELVDDGDAKIVAERILQRLRQPIAIADQQIHSSASIGIAIGPRDSDDPEELMRHADIALYDAKGRGRHCYSFFDPKLNEAARRRSELEKHLRLGLARGELGVVYQPIYRPGQPAQLCGVEALVRWNSAELGPVPPDEFIRVAEEAGLIKDIGHFVMRRATTEIAALVRDYGLDIKLSVNVSANELREGKLAELVDQCLREARLAPRNLMLELTESVMIENLAVVKAQLIEVRQLGATIAVDDFGTGYSSLSYLNRLPITTLKIDRSFVRDLCADAEDRALVRSIVALGHGLDMLVVAEGVESADHVEVLSALGCDQLQGYYFSRPVDLVKLRELVIPQGAGSASA